MEPHSRKVALVTGSSRGIGKAVAIGLAEDGFDLALCARSLDDLKAVQKEILEMPGRGGTGEQQEIAIYQLDVGDNQAVSGMVKSVADRFGRIDLLFNNAGVYKEGTSTVSLEDFSEMLDVNLKSPFHFIRLVVPLMKQQGSGHIINISSRSGKVAKPTSGGYAASKFGLVGLNEALYREVSACGIRVTAICPGWVNTNMASESGVDPSHMLTTGDIVKTVRWLLSLSPAACVKEVYVESIEQVP